MPHDAMPVDAQSVCVGHATITDPGSGHHYFVTDLNTRDGTQADCVTFGGHLVKIETMDENTMLTTHIPAGGTGYVWIGLRYHSLTHHYVWMDGTALGSYDGFAPGPAPLVSDCVDSNGVWNPYTCSQQNHGICECE